jgi:Leucine-rich repeat (LRR) protein
MLQVMADDNPIAAALDLKAPEPSEPKPDEGGITTGLKLFRNTILDLRNLLVAFVLLAVICGSFGYLQKQSPGAFRVAIVLAALCGAIAVWETVLIVQRRSRDKMLKAWAVTPLPSFRDDYFRVGPYESADKDRYHRPDGADRAVIKWVRGAETPLLYLSGMSGTGKSSLINASLIPALERSESDREEMPFVVIRLREFGDPVAQIREAILKPGKIWKNPPTAYVHDDFVSVLSAVCERLENDNKRLLLLFDQFEVVLIRHEQRSEETKTLQELFAALRSGARNRFPNLMVLLSFRSDYDHLLKQFGLPGQMEDENSKKVSAFSRGAASNFLTDPTSGLQLGPERAKAVLDEAEAVDGTRGLIRPIVLNMLGKLLQRLAGKDPGEVPRGALLSDDIRRAVDDPRVRDYSRPVLKNLIHNGIRVPRTVAETSAATGFTAHLVEGCYRVLLEWPLVRSLEHSDEVQQSRWEIAHDFIARLLVPILEAPRRSFGERVRSVAAPVLLLCSLAVIAVSAINSRQRQRDEIFARLSTEYGLQTDEENGVIKARASNTAKVTDKTLPLAANLLLRLRQPVALDLGSCRELQNVDGLKELKALQSLNLRFCNQLRDVDVLKELKALQSLDLSYCNQLQNVDVLKELKALQKLNLSNCDQLQNVDVLKELKALQSLDLSFCPGLQNVDVLKELKTLQTLNLSSCPGLQNVDVLKELKALQKLYLNNCNQLQNVDVLKELKALQSLNLNNCNRLQNVDGLKELKALQSLYLSNCNRLQNVDVLKELKALQKLYLSYCNQLQNVDGLKELKMLQTLNLSYCNQLQNVDVLKELKALQTLDLSNCHHVQNVEAVAISLPNLQYLYLRGTPLRDRATILAMKSKLKSLRIDLYDSEEPSPARP